MRQRLHERHTDCTDGLRRLLGPRWVRLAGSLVLILAAAPLALASPDGKTHARNKRGKTELSGIPWTPAAPRSEPKVVYGEDDRIDVYQEEDARRAAWAASTCALVTPDALTSNGDGTYTLDTMDYLQGYLPACDDEPFGDQPTAAFCTGFVVGTDLIATAGHCIDEYTLSDTRFVFGFTMTDAETAVTTFDESQVYTGIEMVAHELFGEFDYSIVRVDKPITAPGAQVLALRRIGTVPVGTQIGVIGHPAGLPTKIAFGDATVVRTNFNEGYFTTNLDTFGGNSGSPVFNADTGIVEGILVFGADDFVFDVTCFRSNVLGDTEGGGEGVSKSATFAGYIASGEGQIQLGRPRYGCSDTLDILLSDSGLSGENAAEVTVSTPAGDSETVSLDANGAGGVFSGEIPIASGAVAADGILNVQPWETIGVTYNDADAGEGIPGVVTATAVIDCAAPIIRNVSVDRTRGSKAIVVLETNEPCVVTVHAGEACGELPLTFSGDRGMLHSITLTGLDAPATYHFTVEAVDWSGNTTVDDNGGDCYSFATEPAADYFTEGLFEGYSDLDGKSVTFTPDESLSGYQACVEDVSDFPTCPIGGSPLILGDDDFVQVQFPAGRTFTFYGETYTDCYVGSNGYITFGEGDTAYEPAFETHLALPRISGYFSDLAPLGGEVSVREASDRTAVTYDDISDWWGDWYSFQIELFFDGTIRITWLWLNYPLGVVGLSAGNGMPADFEPSALGKYDACAASGRAPVDCGVAPFVCNPFPILSIDADSRWGRLAGDTALLALALAVLAWAGRKRVFARAP